jgi:hypothetical protein
MHVDRRFLGWGVFFIAAGALPLAVRSGYLSSDAIGQAWRLWPLILVGIGIGILLGRTALGWIGGLVVAATFGLLIGAALAGGLDRVGCGFDSSGGTVGGPGTTVNGTLPGDGTVTLDFDCGTLKVAAVQGSQWALTYRGDAVPVVDQAPDRLRVRQPDGGVFPRGSAWDVAVPTAGRLTVDVTANAGSTSIALPGAQLSRFNGTFNAGSFSIDLSGAQLAGLEISLNAGSGSLSLPASSFDGALHVNAGSLKLCTAPDAGLRITTSGSLASTDFSGSGLVLSGTTWESPNYATAQTHVQLTVDANAASVSLNRGGGCQ